MSSSHSYSFYYNEYEIIENIEEEIRQLLDSSSQVESYVITHTQLKFLPPVVCQMTWVTCLDISHNLIIQLPEALGELSQLEKLDISHNQLSTFPSGVHFPRLLTLTASHNRFSSLPFGRTFSAHFPNLQSLDLRHNQISIVNIGICMCHDLTQIFLEGNDLLLPESHRDDKRLLPFLRSLFPNSEYARSCNLNKVRVVFLEPGNIDQKNTLFEKLIGKKNKHRIKRKHAKPSTIAKHSFFVSSRQAWSLEGPETSYTWTLRQSQPFMDPVNMTSGDPSTTLPRAPSLNNLFKHSSSGFSPTPSLHADERIINAWVVTDPNMYLGVIDIHLAARAVYVISFDLRMKDYGSGLDSLLYAISQNAPDSTVFLVGTHASDTLFQSNPELIEKHLLSVSQHTAQITHITEILPVDYETGDGVSTVKKHISRAIYNEEILSEKVEQPYFLVESILTELVQRMCTPVLTVSRFKHLLEDLGLEKKKTYKRYLQLLRDSGAVVYSSSQKLLILSSQWLDECLLQLILLSESRISSATARGFVSGMELAKAWDGLVPSHLHEALLSIAFDFQLVFSVGVSPLSSISNPAAISLIESLVDEKMDSDADSGGTVLPFSNKQFFLKVQPNSHFLYENIFFIIPSQLTPSNPQSHPMRDFFSSSSRWKFQFGSFYSSLSFPINLWTHILVRMLPYFKISYFSSNLVVVRFTDNCVGLIELNKYQRLIKCYIKTIEQKKGNIDDQNELPNPSLPKKTEPEYIYFKQLRDVLDNVIYNCSGLDYAIKVPCYECINMGIRSPYLFEMDSVELEVLKKERNIECGFGHKVLLYLLTPSGLLRDVKCRRINFETDVKVSDKIYKGNFASIFKGSWTLSGASLMNEMDCEASSPLLKIPKSPSFSKALKRLQLDKSKTLPLLNAPLPNLHMIKSKTHMPLNENLPELDRRASRYLRRTASMYEGELPDFSLEEKLALKIFKGKYLAGVPATGTDQKPYLQAFQEFKREVAAMSTLTHENLVSIRAFSLNPFSVVMKWAPLGTLHDLLPDTTKPLSLGLILRIAEDIANGIVYMHSQSPPMLHRDLKSLNILLYSFEPCNSIVAKICDFGCVASLYVPKIKGRVVDQPLWLAPEIMRNEKYDEKVDIYSFGIILWEMISRSLPFAEFEYSQWPSLLEDRICKGLRPTLPPYTPLPLARIIQACWQDNPHLRPSTSLLLDMILQATHKLKRDPSLNFDADASSCVVSETTRNMTPDQLPRHRNYSFDLPCEIEPILFTPKWIEADINPIHKIRGISIQQLIQLATFDNQDPVFVDDIMLTYRMFLSPRTMITLLFQRFDGPSHNTDAKLFPRQFSIFYRFLKQIRGSVLKIMQRCFSDLLLSELLHENLREFILEWLQQNESEIPPLIYTSLINAITNKEEPENHVTSSDHSASLPPLKEFFLHRIKSKSPLLSKAIYDHADYVVMGDLKDTKLRHSFHETRNNFAKPNSLSDYTKFIDDSLKIPFHENALIIPYIPNNLILFPSTKEGKPWSNNYYNHELHRVSSNPNITGSFVQASEVIEKLKNSNQGIRLHAKKIKMNVYICFTGHELIEWFLKNYSLTKTQASDVASWLFGLGFFRRVAVAATSNPQTFVDTTSSLFEFVDDEAFVLASQLTIIDSFCFQLISLVELVELHTILSESKHPINAQILTKLLGQFPSIQTYMNWCKWLGLWVQTEIIRHGDHSSRIGVFTRFIEVAMNMLNINNFNGILQILYALNSPNLSRVIDISSLNHGSATNLNTLSNLMNPFDDFAAYRKAIGILPSTSMIPCFSIIWSDLVRIFSEAPSTFIEKGHEFLQASKLWKLGTLLREVRRYQHRLSWYDLHHVPWVKRCIVHSKVLDEKHLNKISLLEQQSAKKSGSHHQQQLHVKDEGMSCRNLSDRDWNILMNIAQNIFFQAGQVVYEQNTKGNHFLYKILSGSFLQENRDREGHIYHSQNLHPGELFGFINFFGFETIEKIIADGDNCEVLALDVNFLDSLFHSESKLGARFYLETAILLARHLKNLSPQKKNQNPDTISPIITEKDSPRLPESNQNPPEEKQETLPSSQTSLRRMDSIMSMRQKDIKFCKLFGYQNEILITEYPCQRGPNRSGKIYISKNYISYFSKFFGYIYRKTFSYKSISNLNRRDNSEVFEISLWSKTYKFALANPNTCNEAFNLTFNLLKRVQADTMTPSVSTSPTPISHQPQPIEDFRKIGILTQEDCNLLIIEGSKSITFPKNDIIIREGETVAQLYQIGQGVCRIEKKIGGKSVTLGTLKQNAIFGEISFLIGSEAASASVIAESDNVVIYCIELYFMNLLFELRPALSGRFYKFLAYRLSKTYRKRLHTFFLKQ